MSSVKDFLKRKDIVITPQRYLIEALITISFRFKKSFTLDIDSS